MISHNILTICKHFITNKWTDCVNITVQLKFSYKSLLTVGQEDGVKTFNFLNKKLCLLLDI